jgi:hypothetical protein
MRQTRVTKFYDQTPRRVSQALSILLLATGVLSLVGCEEAISPPIALIQLPDREETECTDPDESAPCFAALTGSVIQLDGTSSTDPGGGDLAFSWNFVEVPPGSTARFNDSTIANPSFRADVSGSYKIVLVVSVGDLPSAPDTVVIDVSPCGAQRPVISEITTVPESPGAGTTVRLVADVTDGDNSPDCQLGQRINFFWALRSKPTGSSAVLDDPRLVSPTFVSDVSGSYTVQLEAIDDTGLASTIEELTIDVVECGEARPVVDSITAIPETPAAGAIVRLSSTWSDSDNLCGENQTVTFSWSIASRPEGSRAAIGESTLPEPNFEPDIVGEYVVALVVTDDTGRSSEPGELTITAGECGTLTPQVAEVVVSPASPNTGDLVELAVTAIDPDNDPDTCALDQTVTISSAFVGRPAGSAAELSPAEGPSPAFIADTPGEYVIRTTVIDDTGNTSFRDTTVVAEDCGDATPRITDVTVTPETGRIDELVSLAITAVDSDNSAGGCGLEQVLTFSSALVSQPAGSTATLSPAVGNQPGFVPDVDGQYVVRTTVSDDTGRSSFVDTLIEVSECGAGVPAFTQNTASPGSPNTGDTVELTLAAADPDNAGGACNLGQVVTITSAFVGRPAGSQARLVPAEGPNPSFAADVPGEYVVRSTAEDGTGRSSFIDTTIDVSTCGSAVPTVDGVATLPLNPNTGDSVTFTITVSDDDNAGGGCSLGQELEVVSEFRTRPAGSTATLSTATGLTPGFVADVPGLYSIRTTVTDDTGRTSDLDTDVIVSACGSATPRIDTLDFAPASPNVGSAVTFTIEVSDDDNGTAGCDLGQELTVETRFVGRPAGSSASLSTTEGLAPAFVADVAGDYSIRTTVTDETGRSANQIATVTVSACGSAAPSLDDVDVVPLAPNTGDPITLTVSASDLDNLAPCSLGQILDIESVFVARPAGSSASLSTAQGSTPAFVADVPGNYVVRSTVTDSTGRTDSLDTPISVSTCGSATPVITSVVPAPANPNVGTSITFTISASDADNAGGCALAQTLEVSSEFVARPAGSSAALSTSEGLAPAFVADIPGVYTLRSTVSDDTGRSSFTETSIAVSTCGSASPSVDSVVASPGSPNVGDAVLFTIAVSDADNDVACALGQTLTTTSSFIARPVGSTASLSTSEGLSPGFVADRAGTYTIRTVVADGTGLTETRDTSVVVSTCGAAPPVVDSVVVAPASPNVGDAVTFTIAVSDADNGGACGLAQVLDVSSRFVARPAGSSATLSTAEGLSPGFIGDIPGDYVVRTTVTDDTGRSAFVDTSVTVTTCGTASPAVDSVVAAPASPNTGDAVTLTIAVSDADNDVACGFSQTLEVTSAFVARPAGSSATLSTAAGLSPSFIGDVPGTYTVRTSVSDGTGRSAFVDTTVTVSVCGAAVPSVDSVTFAPLAPNTGDAVTFTIAVSDADNGGACGLSQALTTSSIFVARPAGSTATLSTSEGLAPAFVADRPGTYTIRTTVTDSTGESSFLDTSVTVSSCGSNPPVVDAVDFTPAAPNTGDTVSIAATVSDPDNGLACGLSQDLDTTLTFVARPAGSIAVLDGTSFIADRPGTFTVRARVEDSTGRSSFVDRSVVVDVCGSRAPTVDSVAVSPLAPNTGDTVALTITASDLDNVIGCAQGQTINLSSEFIARPAGSGATLSTAAGTTPQFIADRPGTYVVRSTATDSTGRSGFRDTTIVVDTCGSNAPTVDAIDLSVDATPVAGPPFFVNTTDTVELAITVSDEDVTTCGLSQSLSVTSTLISQPAGAGSSVSPSTGLDVAFVANRPGSYVVRTVVSDGTGRSTTVDTTVTANVCGSRPPVAQIAVTSPITAGPGVTVDASADPVSPGDTVVLSGAASSDPDTGCLPDPPALTYSWEFTAIPATDSPSFNNPSIASPSFLAAGCGNYEVELTVSDGVNTAVATAVVQASPGADIETADGFTVSWLDGSCATPGVLSNPGAVTSDGSGSYYSVSLGNDSVTETASPSSRLAIGGALDTVTGIDFGEFDGETGLFVSNLTGDDAVVLVDPVTGAQEVFATRTELPHPTTIEGLAVYASVGSNLGPGLRLFIQSDDSILNYDELFTPGVAINLAACPVSGFSVVADIPAGGEDNLFVGASCTGDIIWSDFATFDNVTTLNGPTAMAVNQTAEILAVATADGIIAVDLAGDCTNNCPTFCLSDGIDFVGGLDFADPNTLVVTDIAGSNVYTITGDFTAPIDGLDCAP